jgi:hypothetical protein
MAERHPLDYHDPRNRVPVTDGELWGNRTVVVLVVTWVVFVAGVVAAWVAANPD